MTCKICSQPLWLLEYILQKELPNHNVEVSTLIGLKCGHVYHRRCLARAEGVCTQCEIRPKVYTLITHCRTSNRDDYIHPQEVKQMSEKVCTICLEPWNIFQEESRYLFTYYQVRATIRLDCGHTFHTVCFERWFDENPRCPNCRRDWQKYASVKDEVYTRFVKGAEIFNEAE